MSGPPMTSGPVVPLVCPQCDKRHVDEGEWAFRPHHTHRCVDDSAGVGCGHEWRLNEYVFGAPLNPTIRPTHTCFDDVLDFLVTSIPREQLVEWTVVHGICLAPDESRFAHAWLERDVSVWQSGILDGEAVFYEMPHEVFLRAWRVQRSTRYSVREAVDWNMRTGHYGPWDEEYRSLCGGDRVWMAERCNRCMCSPCMCQAE